jgi:hypothetical protein
MFKTVVLVHVLATALAILVVFSLWIAVLTIALKAILVIFTVFALYKLLCFVWRKYKDSKNQ